MAGSKAIRGHVQAAEESRKIRAVKERLARARPSGRAGASGLAVTLATRDDTRLVGDIEKLIKRKIELEPLELDDDRPPRRPRRDDGDEPRERGFASREYRPRAPAPAPRDPFFDQPYEPSATAEEPLERRVGCGGGTSSAAESCRREIA